MLISSIDKLLWTRSRGATRQLERRIIAEMQDQMEESQELNGGFFFTGYFTVPDISSDRNCEHRTLTDIYAFFTTRDPKLFALPYYKNFSQRMWQMLRQTLANVQAVLNAHLAIQHGTRAEELAARDWLAQQRSWVDFIPRSALATLEWAIGEAFEEQVDHYRAKNFLRRLWIIKCLWETWTHHQHDVTCGCWSDFSVTDLSDEDDGDQDSHEEEDEEEQDRQTDGEGDRMDEEFLDFEGDQNGADSWGPEAMMEEDVEVGGRRTQPTQNSRKDSKKESEIKSKKIRRAENDEIYKKIRKATDKKQEKRAEEIGVSVEDLKEADMTIRLWGTITASRLIKKIGYGVSTDEAALWTSSHWRARMQEVFEGGKDTWISDQKWMQDNGVTYWSKAGKRAIAVPSTNGWCLKWCLDFFNIPNDISEAFMRGEIVQKVLKERNIPYQVINTATKNIAMKTGIVIWSEDKAAHAFPMIVDNEWEVLKITKPVSIPGLTHLEDEQVIEEHKEKKNIDARAALGKMIGKWSSIMNEKELKRAYPSTEEQEIIYAWWKNTADIKMAVWVGDQAHKDLAVKRDHSHVLQWLETKQEPSVTFLKFLQEKYARWVPGAIMTVRKTYQESAVLPSEVILGGNAASNREESQIGRFLPFPTKADLQARLYASNIQIKPAEKKNIRACQMRRDANRFYMDWGTSLTAGAVEALLESGESVPEDAQLYPGAANHQGHQTIRTFTNHMINSLENKRAAQFQSGCHTVHVGSKYIKEIERTAAMAAKPLQQWPENLAVPALLRVQGKTSFEQQHRAGILQVQNMDEIPHCVQHHVRPEFGSGDVYNNRYHSANWNSLPGADMIVNGLTVRVYNEVWTEWVWAKQEIAVRKDNDFLQRELGQQRAQRELNLEFEIEDKIKPPQVTTDKKEYLYTLKEVRAVNQRVYIWKCTIEQWYDYQCQQAALGDPFNFNRTNFNVVLIDSHYYVSKWLNQIKIDRPNWMIWIAGMNFEARYGTIMLPDQNGKVTTYRHVSREKGEDVYHNYIRMETSCNSIFYEHPNVRVQSWDGCINAGWMQWFHWSGRASTLQIYEVPAVQDMHFSRSSSQIDYFNTRYSLDKMKNTIAAMWSDRYFRSSDYVERDNLLWILLNIIECQKKQLPRDQIRDLISFFPKSQVFPNQSSIILDDGILKKLHISKSSVYKSWFFGWSEETIELKIDEWSTDVNNYKWEPKKKGIILTNKKEVGSIWKFLATKTENESLLRNEILVGGKPDPERVRRLEDGTEGHLISSTFKKATRGEIMEEIMEEMIKPQTSVYKESKKVFQNGDKTHNTTVESYYYSVDLKSKEIQSNHSIPKHIKEDYVPQDERGQDYEKHVRHNKKTEKLLKDYAEKIEDIKVVPRATTITKHGPDFEINGQDAQAFEWDSKNTRNMLASWFRRQVKTGLRPERESATKFLKFGRRWIDERMERINKLELPDIATFEEWILSKADVWDWDKRSKYLVTHRSQIARERWNEKDWDFAFSLFVKSGEVYFKESDELSETGNLLNQSSRPRAICNPSDELCGTITWVQQLMFSDIKDVEPGFIQGMTSSQLKDTVLQGISGLSQPSCISSDGSNFDGHQNIYCLSLDRYWWQSYERRMKAFFAHHKLPYPEVLARGMIYLATRSWTPIFLQFNTFTGSKTIPSISETCPEWKKMSSDKTVRKYFKVGGSNWVHYYVYGTTFSGHPTRTTLGNTIRSLIYHHYLSRDVKLKFVVASGDDVCTWMDTDNVDKYINRMKKETARNTDAQQVGFGQCIKEWTVSDWWNMDFCSKHCELTMSNWGIYRDGRKCWREKMFYNGGYQIFHEQPELHLIAMQESAKIELNCPLIDEFYTERINRLKKRARTHAERKRIHENQTNLSIRQQAAAVFQKERSKYKWNEAAENKGVSPQMSAFFFTDSGWREKSLLEWTSGSEKIALH